MQIKPGFEPKVLRVMTQEGPVFELDSQQPLNERRQPLETPEHDPHFRPGYN